MGWKQCGVGVLSIYTIYARSGNTPKCRRAFVMEQRRRKIYKKKKGFFDLMTRVCLTPTSTLICLSFSPRTGWRPLGSLPWGVLIYIRIYVLCMYSQVQVQGHNEEIDAARIRMLLGLLFFFLSPIYILRLSRVSSITWK